MLRLGIVRLQNVGKSTLFNALTNAGALVENYPFATINPTTDLVPVPTAPPERTSRPTRPVGGNLGIASNSAGAAPIAGMTGTYQVCSKGVLGKFAVQLDVQMDDGQPCTGSMRAIPDVGTGTTTGTTYIKSAKMRTELVMGHCG